MSKKLENIDIEVNELKGKNLPTWEVVIALLLLRLVIFYLLIVLKAVLTIYFHTSPYMKNKI